MADGRQVGGAIDGFSFARGHWRQLARFVLEGLAAGLVASLVFGLAVFIVTSPALGATPHDAGALYLKASDGGPGGNRVATPLVFTDVRMSVTGIVNRVTVEQRFVNPTDEWREGVYVFPLPEKAAVDHLRMQVGERVIEGMIKERGEAKRTYEAAKSEGRKATLLDEERPNMFTTSVANIGPRDEIVVAIEYQETVRYDDGTFRLRFPMAITPRYIPGEPVAAATANMGWSAPTDVVSDADRVTPPVVPRSEGYVLPVRMTVDLDTGVAVSSVSSTYHPMDVEARGDHRYRLTLLDGPVPASRDFELAWKPVAGAAPATALFTETKGTRTYALLMALPPTAATTTSRVPREVTYIIDTSGSMEGVSMAQARDALAMALERLRAGDRFNVIEFNSTTRSLFAAPVDVDDATLSRARDFVSGLRARGGTEMLPALEIALAGPRTASMLRQVVFLTDGAVGNEDEILKLVGERIGDRRLFTVGIGPAPNMFFMTKAAQFGRGTYTAIGDVREVREKMTALFRKLEAPALTDIDVAWPAGADVWPRVVPDLYAGEPVVVTASYDASAARGEVLVSGRRDGAAWATRMATSSGGMERASEGAGGAGIGVLWARAKIDALMDAGRRGAPQEDIRAAVLDVALTHHLVSKFTSLVAVDVTPARPEGIVASKTMVPGNISEGLTGFDQLPRTATPAPLLMLAGAVGMLLAAALTFFAKAGRPTAGIAILALSASLAATHADAEPRRPAARNQLLLPGHYDGDAGSFDSLPADVPDTGWFVLVKDAAGLYLNRIPDTPGQRPAFLHELERATLDNSATLQSALGQLFYVNLPRAALRPGPIVEVPLRRRALVPVNGRTYALTLGDTPFSLTVHNGRTGRAGAHYVIEHGGARYEYLLDGFGWDSEIEVAGDLDRDGRPDFVVYVNGNNAGTWYLLLSSEAKPGMNMPSASLTAHGC
ncbi:MAG: marine proteobacterial sortase target protein [Burkholderiales bacterium]